MSLTSLDLLHPGAPVWVQDLGPVCLPLSKCTVSIVPPRAHWEAPQLPIPLGRTSIPKFQQEIHPLHWNHRCQGKLFHGQKIHSQ